MGSIFFILLMLVMFVPKQVHKKFWNRVNGAIRNGRAGTNANRGRRANYTADASYRVMPDDASEKNRYSAQGLKYAQDMPAAKNKRKRTSRNSREEAVLQKNKSRAKWKAWGGTLAAGMFGITALEATLDIIEGLFYGYFFSDEIVVPAIALLIMTGSIILARKGFKTLRDIRAYHLYDRIIGKRKVCPVADIARSSGRTNEEVLKELGEMIREGYFPLGFVDSATNCFYADNDTWREMNPERAQRQDGVIADEPEDFAGEELKKEKAQEGPAEVNRYMDRLNEQIHGIENQEIRTKASQLYNHAGDIFAWVELHPECADDVRRFCGYYLPTATKLLDTYIQVEPHADESSVAAGIQNEVSHVLDTMTQAFRSLMDQLLQNTAVDMQAEISALETVLTQEGLVSNGFSTENP